MYDKKTKLEKMGKSVLSRTPNEHYLISNDEWRIVFGVNTILELFQDVRKILCQSKYVNAFHSSSPFPRNSR